ncbi:MAG: TetR/AcrR family transcriptional regulator [Planctomycetota bacterium]
MPDSQERKQELIPVLARAFSELGFRRATTAELARRCEVQENILYRLWKDKRAMFVDAIEYVYDLSAQLWEELLAENGDGRTAAERVLACEAEHHGEFGLYRIIFAGLMETDDEEIRQALRRMYGRYQSFVQRRLEEHRAEKGGKMKRVGADLSAWAILGMGTVTSIGRDLGLLSNDDRRRLWEQIGRVLIEAKTS